MKKIAIISTTINVPLFLKDIAENIKFYKSNQKFDISIYVIGDKKTPKKAKEFCQKLSKLYSLKILFFDINFQDKFFKKNYPSIYKLFPYNDAIRKLLGSVFVLKDLPDKVILIDDDNFCNKNQNFIKDFDIVGKVYNGKTIYNQNCWPNIYKSFKEKNNIPLYPRGFPWKYRNDNSFKFKNKIVKKHKIIANCGFILNDPDIDAVSRLFFKIKTIDVRNKNYFVIAKNNFFPLNDQNLGISKEYIALYYKPLSGGRNSDIWSSYLLSKVSSYHNELISYGRPHLTQVRNVHDYWNDYELEKKHNIATDFFVDIIDKIALNKKNTRFKNYVYLCDKAIFIANNIIKSEKNKYKNKKNNIRHYQNISINKLIERNITSLEFVIDYFKEYKLWLLQIKKYKFNIF